MLAACPLAIFSETMRGERDMGRRIWLVILGWIGLCVFLAVVSFATDLGDKSFRVLLYGNVVHYGIWALTLPLLVKCVQWFPPDQGHRFRHAAVLLLITVVLAIAVSLGVWATIFYTWFPYHSFYPTFRSLLKDKFVWFLQGEILLAFGVVAVLLGRRVWQRFQAEKKRAAELEGQLAQARLEALRMQLHPHFLFNTLHTIAGLISEEPPTARRMVVALGDLLRATLDEGAKPVRSLAEELAFMDLYLGIEKLRFGDRLVVRYEIDADATSAQVPNLLLQPLLENAMKHGAARIRRPCEVTFSARHEGPWLKLLVENDGPVCSAWAEHGKPGIGLSNTKARLHLHYGDNFQFEYLARSQGGVRINLQLPYQGASKSADPYANGRGSRTSTYR
jgi:two-component system LytT family sensor kinase